MKVYFRPNAKFSLEDQAVNSVFALGTRHEDIVIVETKRGLFTFEIYVAESLHFLAAIARLRAGGFHGYHEARQAISDDTLSATVTDFSVDIHFYDIEKRHIAGLSFVHDDLEIYCRKLLIFLSNRYSAVGGTISDLPDYQAFVVDLAPSTLTRSRPLLSSTAAPR